MVINSKLTLKFSTGIASERNCSFQNWKFTKIQQNLIPQKTICLRLSPTTLSHGKFQNCERLSALQWFPKEMPTFVWNKYPCQMLARNSWGYVSILSAALKLGILYLSASICSKYISFICSFLSAHQNQGFQILSICCFRQTRHFIPLLFSVCPPAPNCHIKRSSALQLRTKSPKNCF